MKTEEAQHLAAKEWNAAFDYHALRNGVQVGNIKMLHLDGVNERAMEIYAAQESNKAIDACISEYNKFYSSLYSSGLIPTGKEMVARLEKLKV